jgi:hypothetical protein
MHSSCFLEKLLSESAEPSYLYSGVLRMLRCVALRASQIVGLRLQIPDSVQYFDVKQ